MSRRSQRLASKASITRARDPITILPDLCVDILFSYFTPLQMIAVQRVSKAWREAVEWRFGREAWRRQWTEKGLLTMVDVGSGKWEDMAVAFRRAIYRYEARRRGTPTFIRKFSNAFAGWCVCGDYFVWADHDAINIQRVYNAENPAKVCGPIRRITWKKGSNGKMDIFALHPQNKNSVGPSRLAMVCKQKEELTPFIRYATFKISLVDVSLKRVLWTYTGKGRPPQFVAFNDNVLIYAHGTVDSYIYLGGPVLEVLNTRTGKKISRVTIKVDDSINASIQSIQSHPRQELFFVTINPYHTYKNEIMVLCTKTLSWVGKIKLPVVSIVNAIGIQPSASFRDKTWRLAFDTSKSTSAGGRETIIFYSPQIFREGRQGGWIIHKFELPTDEEIASGYTGEDEEGGSVNRNTAKTNADLKCIRNWRREPVEVVFYKDEHRGMWAHQLCMNPKSRQSSELNISQDSTKLFIETAEEFDKGSFPYSGEELIISEVPEEVINPDSFKVKLFMEVSSNEITKPKKNISKNTPLEQTREPLVFIRNYWTFWKVLLMTERYMVIGQGSENYYISFAPNW